MTGRKYCFTCVGYQTSVELCGLLTHWLLVLKPRGHCLLGGDIAELDAMCVLVATASLNSADLLMCEGS